MWSLAGSALKGVVFAVPVAVAFTDLVARTYRVKGKSMQV